MSKIAIIVGSHRQASQSLKIGQMMEKKLVQHSGCEDAFILNLAKAGLPFWQNLIAMKSKALSIQIKRV